MKISAMSLIAAASITATDRLVLVDDISGTPATFQVALSDLRTKLLLGGGAFASDPLAGISTITTTGAINGQTISATAAFTGTVTVATGLTVTAGGLTVTAGTTAVQALTATGNITSAVANASLIASHVGANTGARLQLLGWANTQKNWQIDAAFAGNDLAFTPSTAAGGSTFTTAVMSLTAAGALTLSAGISATTGTFSGAINGQTISATANFTGTVAVATSISVNSLSAISNPGANELTFGVSVTTANFGGNNTTVNLGPNATTVNVGGSNAINIGTGGTSVVTVGGALASVGFYGVTPIARAVLATGTGKTVDNVITALQNLGLVKQS